MYGRHFFHGKLFVGKSLLPLETLSPIIGLYSKEPSHIFLNFFQRRILFSFLRIMGRRNAAGIRFPGDLISKSELCIKKQDKLPINKITRQERIGKERGYE
jgi:hypothetical protein